TVTKTMWKPRRDMAFGDGWFRVSAKTGLAGKQERGLRWFRSLRGFGPGDPVPEAVVMDRIRFRERGQAEEGDGEHDAEAEKPVDQALLVIEVHENGRHQGSLHAGDRQTEHHVPDVEAVAADIQEFETRHRDGDDGANEEDAADEQIQADRLFDRFRGIGHFSGSWDWK